MNSTQSNITCALTTLSSWIQQGNTIPNGDYNRAMELLESKCADGDDMRFEICRLSLTAIEELLPVNFCASLVEYFTTGEKINVLRKLNQTWKQYVGELKLADLGGEKLTIQTIKKIKHDGKFGIFLNQNVYKWIDFGCNEEYWTNIFKSSNIKRKKIAVRNFKCRAADKLWEHALKKLGCLFPVRGWVVDDDVPLVVMDIAETMLRGIRNQESEYSEAEKYESPSESSRHKQYVSKYQDDAFYKKRNLVFLNNAPKTPWYIIRQENGWYESKLDFFLILEVYVNSNMKKELNEILQAKIQAKFN